MALPEQVFAIRHSAAVSRSDHVRCVFMQGDDVFRALDGLVTSDLRLRDGQMMQSLLLNEDGRIIADILVGRDDEAFFILAEGASAAELDSHLRRHLVAPEVAFEDQMDAHELVSIDGPYAWELLAALAGPDVVGLPYLTFFHFEGGLCLRAGKTGEYGYSLLIRRQESEELWGRLQTLGRDLDAAMTDLEALDQCALENGFFNARREGRAFVTPIELQLQWRLSNRKPFVGSEAVAKRRREGPRQRLTTLVTASPVAVGDEVFLGDELAGQVVNTGASPTLQCGVSLALIDVAWAHPGIDAFRIRAAASESAARSVSPPLLNNRSLHVSPQIHSYGTRHEYTFPPLRRG
jgi:glycine cleavage system aminomethyltransferase T